MEISRAHDLIGKYVRSGSYLGLERIGALMTVLGNPQDKLRFIHIAGTNGKGSTAAMTASILRKAGYRTGLYTSPALREFNERINVDGSDITDEELYKIIPSVADASAKVEAMGFERPSEFEFVTAAAFLYFLSRKCDIVVLEVGMGGRLDATNVIKTPLASVICAIGLDHTRELGDTLAKIAAEKAAIIKNGGLAVSYCQRPEAEEVIAKRCSDVGAELVSADCSLIIPEASDGACQRFSYRGHKDIEISLMGTHQLKNAALVIELFDALKTRGLDVGDAALREGLKNTVWAARMQYISRDPIIILDGAHNPHGVSALMSSLDSAYPDKKFIFVCGILADKAYPEMLALIKTKADRIITTAPLNSRALSAGELREAAADTGINAEFGGGIPEALGKALELQRVSGLPLCICGSLYMAGDVMNFFEGRKL